MRKIISYIFLITALNATAQEELAFKKLPVEICIDGSPIAKEIPYMLVWGQQFPNQFRYKVDAGNKAGLDVPFTNCTTGTKITFHSTMLVVWYLYERGWDVVSVNSHEYSGYNMTEVLLKRK